MSKQTEIKIFDDKQVRTHWDSEQEKWFIAIVDVIAVLTESIDPNAYWRKLKQRLKVEGNERGCLKSPFGLKKESPIQKCRGFLFVP